LNKTYLLRGRLGQLIVALGLLLIISGTSPVLSSPPSQPAETPELWATDRVAGMALRGTVLFWHTSCGDEFSPAQSRLRSDITRDVAGSGNQTHYLSDAATCPGDRVASANVAVDDTYIYWLTGGTGRVVRLPRPSAAGTAPTEVSQTGLTNIGGNPSCCSITVDNTYVFWSESGPGDDKIFRALKAGGPRQQIVSSTDSIGIGNVRATEAGAVYYTDGRALKMLRPLASPAGTYESVTIYNNLAIVPAYALDNRRVYWAAKGSRDYSIMSQSHDGSARGTDYTYTRAAGGTKDPEVDNLAVDETNLYWHDSRNLGSSGRIYRLPLRGGTPVVAVTSDMLIGSPLLSDGQFLFWTDYNTGIYRLRVNVPPVPPSSGDVWVTGMEVSQAIQVENNLVPLVGYKKTVVRVFVQSREDSNGPWAGVQARLIASDSTRYHGSVAITASPSGSHQDRLDDSFTFLLDRSETAPGSRDLTVTLLPPTGRSETDTVNNRLTIRVAFGPARTLIVYGYTYGNTNNNPAGCPGPIPGANDFIPPFSRFDAERDYMENVYPVSSLIIAPMPGSGTRTFDNSSCGASGAAQMAAVGIVARTWPTTQIRSYVLQPDQVTGGRVGWCCNQTGSSYIAWAQYWPGLQGVTAAQEIAHTYPGVFFNQHTFDAGYGYPAARRDSGAIGPWNGVRLTTPFGLVPGRNADGTDAAWDYMSYSGMPHWVSPYTYCKSLNYMSNGSTLCPATVEGGGAGAARQEAGSYSQDDGRAIAMAGSGLRMVLADDQPNPYLLVIGYFDEQGHATFLPFEQVQSTKDLTVPSTGKQYTVALVDGSNKPTASYSFDLPLDTHHPDDKSPSEANMRTFAVYLPWNSATARITLSRDGKVLVERAVSPNAPNVTLLAPAGGATLTGKQTISWKADDADGDPLTYSIWYSRDAGTTWTPLDVSATGTSREINFDNVAGSSKAMIRVLASDGVNTTEARSTGLLHVPGKHPQITLVMPPPITFQEGQDFLAGIMTAWDPEDGPITDDKAFTWTSSQDGQLGTGLWLVPSLKPGEHTLTVTVKDSDGNTSAATVNVNILGEVGRTFKETGKTVKGKFLSYWLGHGGLPQQGFPISEEMQEKSDTDGKVYSVQYFERAVFELHPENKPPYDVLLSLLGNFFYKEKYPNGAPNQKPSTSNAVKFLETGKTLGGRFREYWVANGGLPQQGFPISEEFQEKSSVDGKTYTVQYFERAVFEYHPENKAPYDVLLSLLGRFEYQQKHP
jgi:hypothetical protein